MDGKRMSDQSEESGKRLQMLLLAHYLDHDSGSACPRDMREQGSRRR